MVPPDLKREPHRPFHAHGVHERNRPESLLHGRVHANEDEDLVISLVSSHAHESWVADHHAAQSAHENERIPQTEEE